MRLVLAALPLLLFAAPGLAQRTWIVDAANGPGTDFTDLPPAVQAANPGDLVLVRTGTYSAFVTAKGLRIVAVAPAILVPGTTGLNLAVAGLPSGQTLVIHGFEAPRRQPLRAEIANAAGTVVLSALRAVETCGCGPLRQNPPSIQIADCARVILDACVDYGGPAVSAARSSVILTRCQLGVLSPNDPMGDCLLVDGGTVEVVDSRLDGRAASDAQGVPQPAVRVLAGSLVLRGTSAAFVQGGYEVAPQNPAPAIRATGGALVLDPDVALNPQAGQGVALAVQGAQVTRRQLGAALVRSAGLGGVLQAELVAVPGAPAGLLLALPGAPQVLAFGTLHLDLGATLPLAFGTASAAGLLAGAVPIPGSLPHGLVLAVQGVSDLGAGLELSSPALVPLR